MAHCINCELHPVVTMNGEGFCGSHAEQISDFNARIPPPIANAPYVKVRPVLSLSKSHSPRHYK